MNSQVTATGMKVTTKVDSNMLIGGTSSVSSDADLKTEFRNDSLTGSLQPVSTVDGTNFFYANKAVINGNGSSTQGTNAYVAYTNDSEFAAAINIENSKGMLEYDLILKATANKAEQIVLNGLDLTYTKAGEEDPTKHHAYRVAFFASSAQENLAAAKGATPALVSILHDGSGSYFTSGNAVASTSALGALDTKYAADAVVGDLAKDETKYFRVRVVLWLEGEDKTCTNETFLNLTGSWSLDLKFAFKSTDPVVSAVNKINATVA